MSLTLDLAEQLIAQPSVTPEDAQCLTLIASRLTEIGFACERMDHGPEKARVSNLWAIKRSNQPDAKTLVFAGHTDVVPPGEGWRHDPFAATIADGTGVGTIVDDEPRISIGDRTVMEGNTGSTSAAFTVTLSAAYDVNVTVNYATADGSAASPAVLLRR